MGMLQPGVTHVGGSSAGALAAAVVACELPIEAVLESVRNMMADCRERGVWRRLGPGLRAQVGCGTCGPELKPQGWGEDGVVVVTQVASPSP